MMDDKVNSFEILRRYQTLTQRQRQVCDLVVLSHSKEEIAQLMSIPVDNVVLYRQMVMSKMGAKDMHHLVNMLHRMKSSSF